MKTLLMSAALAALAIPAVAHAQHHDGPKPVTLADHEAKVATHFAKLDANGDGRVTEAEMKAAHEGRMADRKDRHGDRMEARRAKMEARMAEATPEQRARFEEMRAKREEMRELRGEMRGDRHEKMWAAADANGDGALSLAEMQAQARQRFEKMDANGNGRIDEDERRGKRGHRGPRGQH